MEQIAAIFAFGTDGGVVLASTIAAVATILLVMFTRKLVSATNSLNATTGELVGATNGLNDTTGKLVDATEGLKTTTADLVHATEALVSATDRLQAEPSIALVLAYWAQNVFLELHNVGDGAAVDIKVEINWCTDSSGTSMSRSTWSAQVLYPGKRVRFNPPAMPGRAHMQGEALNLFERITVTGSMHNSRGAWTKISQSIEQPIEHWDGEVEARRQFTSNYEPDEMVAAELKQLRQAAERISATSEAVAQHLSARPSGS